MRPGPAGGSVCGPKGHCDRRRCVTRARSRQLLRGAGSCGDGDGCDGEGTPSLPPSGSLRPSVPPSLPPTFRLPPSLPPSGSLSLLPSLPPSLPSLPLPACLPTCLPAYLPACLRRCLPACLSLSCQGRPNFYIPHLIFYVPHPIFYVPPPNLLCTLQDFTRKGGSTPQFTTPVGKGHADRVSTAPQVRFTYNIGGVVEY